jgi:3-methyladenine DNA glycosylase AlkD
MPYHGLTTPTVRGIVRDLLADGSPMPPDRDAWESTVRELWDHATHREERYAAIAIARHRSSKPYRDTGALDLYRHMIESGAWWDLVDEIATHLVHDELVAQWDRTAPIMRAWSVDADMWVRRTAILCQNGSKLQTDTALLRDVIVPNLEVGRYADAKGRQDFFIRKAIGWALREYSYHAPAWVAAFVDDHRDAMAGLTVREALRRLSR